MDTVRSLQRRADRVLTAWETWHGVVAQQTNTTQRPRTVVELRGLQHDAENHARDMRVIMANPLFNQIDEDLRQELALAAVDCETGAAELHEHVHHDKVWTRLDEGKRRDLVQHVPLDDAAVLQARSRLSGDLRGQPSKAPPPNSAPPTPGADHGSDHPPSGKP